MGLAQKLKGWLSTGHPILRTGNDLHRSPR